MIISHEHKFIFLRTRKTASTTLEIALSQVCGPDDVITRMSAEEEATRAARGGRNAQNWLPEGVKVGRLRRLYGRMVGRKVIGRGIYSHMPAVEARALVSDDVWNSYFKFSVERNPWDRQVSLYFWRYPDTAKRPSFRRFITNPLWRKTVDNFAIYSIDGKIIADHVMRYDRLGEDFAETLQRIGIADVPTLGHAKATTRTSRADYRTFYDDETRAIVGRWYAREIAAFGFEF